MCRRARLRRLGRQGGAGDRRPALNTSIAAKCFGIGLNKTGTKSLGGALRALGYSTVSYRSELMRAIGRGDPGPALAVAAEFDGFEDWPWPLIYKELDRAFPGSKFVLTMRRDAPTWLVSLTRHAERTGPTVSRQIAYGHALLWDDPADHIQVYERHAREVIEHFAGREDQLRVLCWERGDGWEELCGFLGRPAPAEPFPNTNTTDRQSEPDNGVGRRDRRDRR